jgi:hypothetical protein
MAIGSANFGTCRANAVSHGEQRREVAGDRGMESTQLPGIRHLKDLLTVLSGGVGAGWMGVIP